MSHCPVRNSNFYRIALSDGWEGGSELRSASQDTCSCSVSNLPRKGEEFPFCDGVAGFRRLIPVTATTATFKAP